MASHMGGGRVETETSYRVLVHFPQRLEGADRARRADDSRGAAAQSLLDHLPWMLLDPWVTASGSFRWNGRRGRRSGLSPDEADAGSYAG